MKSLDGWNVQCERMGQLGGEPPTTSVGANLPYLYPTRNCWKEYITLQKTNRAGGCWGVLGGARRRPCNTIPQEKEKNELKPCSIFVNGVHWRLLAFVCALVGLFAEFAWLFLSTDWGYRDNPCIQKRRWRPSAASGSKATTK